MGYCTLLSYFSFGSGLQYVCDLLQSAVLSNPLVTPKKQNPLHRDWLDFRLFQHWSVWWIWTQTLYEILTCGEEVQSRNLPGQAGIVLCHKMSTYPIFVTVQGGLEVCVLKRQQQRHSQAMMSSSISPSCPLSHQGTVPKTAARTAECWTVCWERRLCHRQYLTERAQLVPGRHAHNNHRHWPV